MIRLIKRYESRKLYDTEESRYVSLEDIAGWVRVGQEVKVVDNATSEDVTAQTLTQIILDDGRRGKSLLPSDLLHELVRFGQKAVSSGVGQIQDGMDKFVRASIDRLAPVRQAREEMTTLRRRLEELEASLEALESQDKSKAAPKAAAKPKPKPRATAKRAPAKKTPAKKPATRATGAKRTTQRKTAK